MQTSSGNPMKIKALMMTEQEERLLLEVSTRYSIRYAKKLDKKNCLENYILGDLLGFFFFFLKNKSDSGKRELTFTFLFGPSLLVDT